MKGSVPVKRNTVISAVLAAFIALTASCAESTAPQPASSSTDEVLQSVLSVSGNVTRSPDEQLVDAMNTESEKNVELAVMRVGKIYRAYCKGGEHEGWSAMYSDEPELADGGFALIKADITRLCGGEPGYDGDIEVKKLISSAPMTFAEAAAYTGMGSYDPCSDEIYMHDPELCGEYCIVYSYPAYHVYRNGEVVGEYESLLSAQAAMGVYTLDDPTVEIRDVTKETLTVIRVGDTYLSYVQSIFMNNYWTPILNKELRNEPTGFGLADGEAVYITADISVLNGGEAGYVNAPLIRSVRNIQSCGYNELIVGCSAAAVPWYEVWEIQQYGDSCTEAGTRIYLDKQENTCCGYDYYNGTWLIFWIDGKFRVYKDDYTGAPQLYGIFESTSAVDDDFRHRS